MSLDTLIEERNRQALAGVHSALLVDVCSVVYYLAFSRMDSYKRGRDSARLVCRIAAETAFFVRAAMKSIGLKMCVLCFDSKYSLRKSLYAPYKSKRREKPLLDAERFVIDCAKDAAAVLLCNGHLLGFQTCNAYGYEADDCIAVNVNYLSPRLRRIVILSSDQDLFQLLGGNVLMAKPIGGALIGQEGVVKETGVTPDKIAEFKALAGCKSDDIPGVTDIGEKTAVEYLTGKPTTARRKALIEAAEADGSLAMWRLLTKLPFPTWTISTEKGTVVYPQPFVCFDSAVTPLKREGWLEQLARDAGVNEDEFVSLSESEETIPEPEEIVFNAKGEKKSDE